MKTAVYFFSSRLRAFLFPLLCLPALWGCENPSLTSGVVASVNGQAVSYREMETRRINLFAGRSAEAQNWSEVEIRAQYRYVINQIIEELIICQYMENKQFVPEPDSLDMEEQRIRKDYPEGVFEQMLMEEGIHFDEWRESLRRRLVIKQFLAQVLRPEITITADEVHQYFTTHNDDFFIPEQWHFIQISGLDKKTVENARNSFIANRNATTVQKEFLISVHDVRMGKDRLPEDLYKEIVPLEIWQGSRVKAVDDGFRTVVLIEKSSATMLEPTEMAKRVEHALVEDKMRVLYAAWMEQRLARANIRLASSFFLEHASEEESGTPLLMRHNATSH
ncbi:MAG: SurA N-terminal domain-containing protein [Desulfovibrio sp.]|jgi:hypothetical protein|nr:SurA N-terminal domain-containing protein [Desulfovibrio sp.]